MDHDRDNSPDANEEGDTGKSSGGLTGGEKSLSADGTTSGGIGSGANSGTGGDVGNWADAGSIEDAAAATEGKEIVYPSGTGAAAIGDWSARQSGTGRESNEGKPDEDDDAG